MAAIVEVPVLRATCATLSTLALSAGLVATATPALADDRICRGTLGSTSVSTNIVVPSGASCTLNGTRVDGNVIVRGNGSVLITNDARIDGNVQAEDRAAATVRIRGSQILGDVQVKTGARVVIRTSSIDGNIQLNRNRGAMTIIRNTVEGDIQVFSSSARAEIRRNVVDGNLQCKGNSPRPIGGDNRVSGNKEDQCRSL